MQRCIGFNGAGPVSTAGKPNQPLTQPWQQLRNLRAFPTPDAGAWGKRAVSVAAMGKMGIVALASALVMGFAVTGCHGHHGCPAIGWSNEVTIAVTGNLDAMDRLELCAGGTCEASESLLPPATPTASPTGGEFPSINSFSRVDARTWSASTAMTTPQTATVRALSAAGEVLAEKEAVLEWRREGGTRECGGPGAAGPVTLDLPA